MDGSYIAAPVRRGGKEQGIIKGKVEAKAVAAATTTTGEGKDGEEGRPSYHHRQTDSSLGRWLSSLARNYR